MKKIIAVVTMGLALALVTTGCKKKEEQPAPQAPMQAPAGGQMPPGHPAPAAGPKVEKKLIIPDNVKATWKKVKLEFEDKVSKKKSDFTVAIGSEMSIPNTNLKVRVGEFLPTFKMDEASITSDGNEPNNPAVRVEIMEGGNVVFKGWLYSKFPGMHPFEHQKYGLILKDGLKG